MSKYVGSKEDLTITNDIKSVIYVEICWNKEDLTITDDIKSVIYVEICWQ